MHSGVLSNNKTDWRKWGGCNRERRRSMRENNCLVIVVICMMPARKSRATDVSPPSRPRGTTERGESRSPLIRKVEEARHYGFRMANRAFFMPSPPGTILPPASSGPSRHPNVGDQQSQRIPFLFSPEDKVEGLLAIHGDAHPVPRLTQGQSGGKKKIRLVVDQEDVRLCLHNLPFRSERSYCHVQTPTIKMPERRIPNPLDNQTVGICLPRGCRGRAAPFPQGISGGPGYIFLANRPDASAKETGGGQQMSHPYTGPVFSCRGPF